MWQRYYGRFGDLADTGNLERCLAAMLAHPSIQALSPDAAHIRREFREGPATYGNLFAVIHAQFAAAFGKRRWGAQIGLIEEYADVIFADYPSARMIHMVGDPRDRGQRAANRPRRTGKTGWEMAKWLHSVGLAKRNRYRYPNRYLVVSSESLLNDPQAVLRHICAFLGEAFEPDMVTMGAAVRFGESLPAEERRPPASTQQLSRRDLAFTQVYARAQLVDLGYELRPIKLTVNEQLLFNIIDRPANLASLYAWRAIRSLRSRASH